LSIHLLGNIALNAARASLDATDMHLVGTTCSSAIPEEDFLVKQEDLSLSRRNIYHRLLDFRQEKQNLRFEFQ